MLNPQSILHANASLRAPGLPLFSGATGAAGAHILHTPTGLRADRVKPRGLALEREPGPTVVVLTRPPGCVQVQPD